MAEDTEEDEEAADEPLVELGEGSTVEGAPIGRVVSRLTWPIERSSVIEKEGETVIRTSEGPRDLSAVLEAVDTTYFATRKDFLEAIRGVVGTGPVPTE